MSKLKICHFSDWHGMWRELPEADLYLCTGDMLPNSLGHKVDWLYEERFQAKFIKDNPIEIPNDSPVYVVRGNHDHIDLAKLFLATTVIEFDDEISMDGIRLKDDRVLRIGGMRGVRRIHGNGPDEMSLEDLENKVADFLRDEKFDILLTHTGPYGILDRANDAKALEDPHTGSKTLRSRLEFHEPLLHCFGHVHTERGIRKLGKTICSNAATTINTFEIEV